jgi:hypothetical protein
MSDYHIEPTDALAPYAANEVRALIESGVKYGAIRGENIAGEEYVTSVVAAPENFQDHGQGGYVWTYTDLQEWLDAQKATGRVKPTWKPEPC